MTKRIIIASITGLTLGISCWGGGILLGLIENPSGIHVANILAHRTLMGLVIGISTWKIHWALRGAVLGSIVGSLFILFDAYIGMPYWLLFGILIPVNAFYGVIISFTVEKILSKEVKF